MLRPGGHLVAVDNDYRWGAAAAPYRYRPDLWFVLFAVRA